MIPDNLRCEVCAAQPAELVIVRRRADDIDRTFVCPACAREKARLAAGAGIDFEHVLARVHEAALESSPSHACRLCGTTLAQIVAEPRPGCCLCYLRFADQLQQAAYALHGRTRHVGKAPRR